MLVWASMDCTPHESKLALAEQERRVKSLEQELAQSRATVNMLRAELVSAAHGVPLPDFSHEAAEDPQAAYYLAPLKPGGRLSRKWKLGAGLPQLIGKAQDAAGGTQGGHSLLLYGVLSDGSPWQVNVSFDRLAKDGGCIIGRDHESCDIVLDEPGISRCHARLELTDEGLVVTDENSTNGVWVDDKQLNAYERRMHLKDGAILALGNVLLRAEYN